MTSTCKARATPFAKCHHVGLIELAPNQRSGSLGNDDRGRRHGAQRDPRIGANTAGVGRQTLGKLLLFVFEVSVR